MPKLTSGNLGFNRADVERAKLIRRAGNGMKSNQFTEQDAQISDGAILVKFVPDEPARSAEKPRFKNAQKYLAYCAKKQAQENQTAIDEDRPAVRVCPYTDKQMQVRLQAQEKRELAGQTKRATKGEGIKPEKYPIGSRYGLPEDFRGH